jgi:hypothetical protein
MSGVQPGRFPRDNLTCPGCHSGDFPDFDHYVETNRIPSHDWGDAFGAWLHHSTGWQGQTHRVDPDGTDH